MKTEQPTQTRDGICEREIPDPHVLIYSSYSVGAKKKSQQIVAPTRSNQSIYSGISPMMNQWTNGSICHGSSVSCRSSRSYQMYIRNMLAFFHVGGNLKCLYARLVFLRQRCYYLSGYTTTRPLSSRVATEPFDLILTSFLG